MLQSGDSGAAVVSREKKIVGIFVEIQKPEAGGETRKATKREANGEASVVNESDHSGTIYLFCLVDDELIKELLE